MSYTTRISSRVPGLRCAHAINRISIVLHVPRKRTTGRMYAILHCVSLRQSTFSRFSTVYARLYFSNLNQSLAAVTITTTTTAEKKTGKKPCVYLKPICIRIYPRALKYYTYMYIRTFIFYTLAYKSCELTPGARVRRQYKINMYVYIPVVVVAMCVDESVGTITNPGFPYGTLSVQHIYIYSKPNTHVRIMKNGSPRIIFYTHICIYIYIQRSHMNAL